MKNRSHGYTVLELMITVALMAVILGIGVPSFREFSRNNRMVSIANDFLSGIQSARTEAIKRQITSGGVSICPSKDPEADEPECLGEDTRQFNGWIAFIDTNGDCERDDDDTVLKTGSRIDLTNTPVQHVGSISDGSCLSFAATGFLRKAGARPEAKRTLFCDERGSQMQPGTNLSIARGVEVTTTGRARVTRDIEEISKWDVKCP